MRTSPRTTAIAFLIDAALVLVFVLVGRASHDENPVLGALVTFWPFLVALAVGWVVARGWNAPFAIARTGVPVWATTVVVGMLLRAVSDQGVQVSFVIVASIVLAVFLVGWRAISRIATSARRARTP